MILFLLYLYGWFFLYVLMVEVMLLDVVFEKDSNYMYMKYSM